MKTDVDLVSDELVGWLARSSRVDERDASWGERTCRRAGLCFFFCAGFTRTVSCTIPPIRTGCFGGASDSACRGA